MDGSSSSSEEDAPFPCASCLETCVDPVTALCGAHNFCLPCLSDWVSRCAQNGQAPTCPSCRHPIQRRVEDLKVNIGLREEIARRAAKEARRRAKDAAKLAAVLEKQRAQPPQLLDIPWADVTVRPLPPPYPSPVPHLPIAPFTPRPPTPTRSLKRTLTASRCGWAAARAATCTPARGPL